MKKVHLLLFALILVLAGCSSNSENMITHLPFKTEKDGRWGLIDMEGNILIEDEFKTAPSVVIDGRFCVKNSDDLYEFYTAEKKFKQIGEEYLSVGYFSEGLAPVVKKDSRITYINKDGEVVFELTKYKDDPIETAYSFENGIARVTTASGKCGYINTKGEFVVSPIYSSTFHAGKNVLLVMDEKEKWGYINYKGKTLVEPKYSDGYAFNDNGYAVVLMDGKQIVINKKGKEILKIKDGMKITEYTDENLMPYSIDNKSYGYLNLDGEKVIKLSSNIKEPSSFLNGYATFKNSDNDYGTIDEEGEVVIRAKYDELNMYNDFMLYKDDREWGFLSYSGDVIKRACYKEILPFLEGNKYTYAKDGDEWILIDKKGEDTKKVEVDNIGYYAYDNFGYPYYVESDYWDIEVEVSRFMKILNEDGTFGNLTFNVTPEEFVDRFNPEYKEYTPYEVARGSGFLHYDLSPMQYVDIELRAHYHDHVPLNSYILNQWGGQEIKWNSTSTPTMLSCQIELKDKLSTNPNEVLDNIRNWLENRGYTERKASEETDNDWLTFKYIFYTKSNKALDIIYYKNKRSGYNEIIIETKNKDSKWAR